MANNPHEWDMGWEYFYDGPPTKKRFLTFGFALSPWQTVPYAEYPSIGLFEGDRFDPTTWKPQTPVAAYIEMRADDAFWAARRVMAFTDDLIRAAVHTGQYSDPAAERHLAAVLIKRRDAIGRAYLTAINPIVNPRLDATGALTFENAAVAAGFAEAPAAYHAAWSRFDNATGATQPIAETRSATTTMSAPRDLPSAPGSFIEIDISAESAAHPSWQQPVRTYFRRTRTAGRSSASNGCRTERLRAGRDGHARLTPPGANASEPVRRQGMARASAVADRRRPPRRGREPRCS